MEAGGRHVVNPSTRMLKVLEYLNASQQRPVRQVDIARACGLSPATLSRIVAELSQWGYVVRSSDNQVIGNFRFERNLRMTETYQKLLQGLIQEITATHGIVAEVIVNAGNDLLWQSSTVPTDGTVLIRARPGFRRGLMELDVLSRLYLARLDEAALRTRFDGVNFSTTGIRMELLSEAQVRRVLEAARPLVADHDFEGNRQSIRRFATWLPDSRGRFVHLLALAEPAVPVADREATIAHRLAILGDARARLLAEIARETADLGVTPVVDTALAALR